MDPACAEITEETSSNFLRFFCRSFKKFNDWFVVGIDNVVSVSLSKC